MALLVFVAVLVVAILAAHAIGPYVAARPRRPSDRDRCANPAPSHRPPAAATPRDAVEFDSVDELAEIVLVASRIGGNLPTGSYQRAMAILAAEDEAHHPMPMPPERSA